MEGIYNLELLEQKISDLKGLLLYFSSDTCSVCKVLKPKVASLMQELFPHMQVYYIDTEKSPVLSGQHRIFTIPTILVFFEGKEHMRLSRSISLYQLEDAIAKPYGLVFED